MFYKAIGTEGACLAARVREPMLARERVCESAFVLPFMFGCALAGVMRDCFREHMQDCMRKWVRDRVRGCVSSCVCICVRACVRA